MASRTHIVQYPLATFLIMSLVLMAADHPYAEAAITCGTVASSIAPCITYITGQVKGGVPPVCCSGIQRLRAASITTSDFKTACTCLKTLAAGIKNLNYGLAAGIPGACRVNIPFKISPNTDCSKIQ